MRYEIPARLNGCVDELVEGDRDSLFESCGGFFERQCPSEHLKGVPRKLGTQYLEQPSTLNKLQERQVREEGAMYSLKIRNHNDRQEKFKVDVQTDVVNRFSVRPISQSRDQNLGDNDMHRGVATRL
jgi:hypothetical protein